MANGSRPTSAKPGTRRPTPSAPCAPRSRRFMLDQTTRATILRLHEAGHGTRAIARTLAISRNAVKRVLADGGATPPTLSRTEKGEPHRDDILALFASCKGNLVRVHEEL